MTKARFEYLEQCADYAASFDPDKVGTHTLGVEIGRGNFFAVAPLGTFAVRGSELHVAAKWGHQPASDVYSSIISEIACISLILREAPELTPLMPLFICELTVDGKERALLTEDASKGGLLDVRSMGVSDSTRQTLYEAFSAYGSRDAVFMEEEQLNRSLAFDVGGQEKLLDFTPPPLKSRIRREASIAVIEHLESGKLTVNVSGSSALGQAFHD